MSMCTLKGDIYRPKDSFLCPHKEWAGNAGSMPSNLLVTPIGNFWQLFLSVPYCQLFSCIHNIHSLYVDIPQVSVLSPLFSLLLSLILSTQGRQHFLHADDLKSLWLDLVLLLSSPRISNGRLASSPKWPACASTLTCPKVLLLPQPTQSFYLPINRFLLFPILLVFLHNHLS